MTTDNSQNAPINISADTAALPCYFGIDHQRQQPIFFPFAAGQYRLSLGLYPLELAEWFNIDGMYLNYLHQKQQRLDHFYAESVMALPETTAAQQELLELLLNYLPTYYPDYFQRQDHQITNLKTNQVWHLQDFATIPIDLAGRLVQDDLCLLVTVDNTYQLGAASVCFPLHWRLSEKMGQSLIHIHAPVPDYPATLQQPVDRYFQMLRTDAPGYRFNWSLVDRSELPLDPETVLTEMPAEMTAENLGEHLWIRVERQTLRRLPQTQAILFAIRTYVYPLSLLQQHPAAAAGFAQVLDQVPAQMQAYKNIAKYRQALQIYLDRIRHIS
jgi:dimethylamine monooxygenase subunit A